MTKVLVLGGAGMLGHKIVQTLNHSSVETYATVRRSVEDSPAAQLAASMKNHFIGGVDASDFASISTLMDEVNPDVVINCVGVIKQRDAAHDSIESISINSLLPHLLAEKCGQIDARMIHFSTDCVFDGVKGAYEESDTSNATDLYGRTKYLGEVSSPGSLTLRSSIIGRELYNDTSLFEWFLAQEGKKIRGFAKAMYSGVTTVRMSNLVKDLILDHPDLSGMYHVSGPWISKYDLLLLARDIFELNIEIERDEDFDIDRTLVGDRFAADSGFAAPSWEEMLAELAADPTPYESWKP
ncbi:MAG: SDR family oxidoreductase [Chloroflexi bacterium]|jgi:dTDP-4-dehydrorhamnose reductase|nr:SDR family oxidoreductase [Chloroflexota bacterium]MBT4073000.1 SDR family oxidoreductase [Chloroflexota bacterium]MBT4515358.1 SDR family oxidoreductase [Chloroflexota bacterium]MBT5318708.1 SDR family oxidoreductase [Chloroflexota bacterium]MBT6680754.1 SDR family oxidoreductase [Chloroflexota bacterium]